MRPRGVMCAGSLTLSFAWQPRRLVSGEAPERRGRETLLPCSLAALGKCPAAAGATERAIGEVVGLQLAPEQGFVVGLKWVVLRG